MQPGLSGERASAPRPVMLLAFLALFAALLWLPTPSLSAQEDPPPDPTEDGEAAEADGADDDEDDDGQAIGGRLRDEDNEPVPGVTIVVTDPDGREIGEDTTADDGTWRIPLPGAGTYQVTLLEDSLPEGVGLRDPDRASIERNVRPGRDTTAIFQLGEGERTGRATLDRFLQASVNGLKFGLIIAMTAIGLSLIFGTSGLINFAHGELVTFGAVMAWFLNAQGPGWHLLLAGAVAIVLGGVLGGSLELGLLRPLRRRKVGLFQLLVISIGLSLLLRHALQLFFGGGRRSYTDYVIQQRISIGPVAVAPRDLAIMAISVAVLVGVAFMLQRTRMGKAMRAVSDNVDLAESSGIDVQRVLLFVWVLGAALAAAGGLMLGAIESISYLMGFRLLLLMFAGVILGGLGTAYGALVGSIVIGLVTEISTVWFSPELKLVFALGALIVVLLVRPQGILGIKERIG